MSGLFGAPKQKKRSFIFTVLSWLLFLIPKPAFASALPTNFVGTASLGRFGLVKTAVAAFIALALTRIFRSKKKPMLYGKW